MPLWKLGTRDRDDHSELERHHWEKDHFRTKKYHVTLVASNVANLLISDMSVLHDMSPWYSQTRLKEMIWLLPSQELLKFTSIDTDTKLCHGIMQWFYGCFLFCFWKMWCHIKGLCDIKFFKMWTAYDVWLSRYRPSNLMITVDFALVLVIINFFGAVYSPYAPQRISYMLCFQ